MKDTENRQSGSEPTKILHLSDTHIGYSLREEDEKRDQDTVDWIDEVDCVYRFRRAMEEATDREVDAVMHTGDVFDEAADYEKIEAVGEILSNTIEDAGIPFYYIPGNHDSGKGKEELENLERAGLAESLGRRTPKRVGEDEKAEVVLYGVKYKSREWWSDPVLPFNDDVPDDSYKILCLHQSVSPICEGASEVSADKIVGESNVEFDLLAMGHEHEVCEKRFLPQYNFEAYYPGPTGRISDEYEDRVPSVNLYTFSESIDKRGLPVS